MQTVIYSLLKRSKISNKVNEEMLSVICYRSVLFPMLSYGNLSQMKGRVSLARKPRRMKVYKSVILMTGGMCFTIVGD